MDFPHGRVKLTWIECFDETKIDAFKPIAQVYGVCFNDAGDILTIDTGGRNNWIIPGGSPEKDETVEQTLRRELIEEADVEVGRIAFIGAQQVDDPSNPDPDKKVYFQLRFAAQITKLQEQTPDPDGGKIYQRKFVAMKRICETVKWGRTGEAMFASAIKAFKEILSA